MKDKGTKRKEKINTEGTEDKGERGKGEGGRSRRGYNFQESMLYGIMIKNKMVGGRSECLRYIRR
jgi:hypothetical protein